MNTHINTNRESQIGNSRNNYGFIRKLFGSVNLGYSDIVIGNHAEVRFLLFGKYHTLSGRQVFFSTCGERDGERSKGRSRKGGRGRGQEAGGDTGTLEFGLAWASVAMGTESTLTDRRFTPGSDGCPRGKRGGASGSVACLADFLLSHAVSAPHSTLWGRGRWRVQTARPLPTLAGWKQQDQT